MIASMNTMIAIALIAYISRTACGFLFSKGISMLNCATNILLFWVVWDYGNISYIYTLEVKIPLCHHINRIN